MVVVRVTVPSISLDRSTAGRLGAVIGGRYLRTEMKARFLRYTGAKRLKLARCWWFNVTLAEVGQENLN
jgi:hypothetical protein